MCEQVIIVVVTFKLFNSTVNIEFIFTYSILNLSGMKLKSQKNLIGFIGNTFLVGWGGKFDIPRGTKLPVWSFGKE